MLNLVNLLLEFFQSLGYGGIFLLMTIESSFIPFPSEVVIPPAAYLAFRGEMNIFLVAIFGILGSLLGAIINYFLAFFLGRPIIYALTETKFSRLILINSRKIKKAEDFFLRYGSFSTFFGRLIPVIRQLISLPAGFSKMNFLKFIFYTTLGSGVWVVILAFLGYFFGANQELIIRYYKEISLAFVVLILVIIAILVLRKNRR